MRTPNPYGAPQSSDNADALQGRLTTLVYSNSEKLHRLTGRQFLQLLIEGKIGEFQKSFEAFSLAVAISLITAKLGEVKQLPLRYRYPNKQSILKDKAKILREVKAGLETQTGDWIPAAKEIISKNHLNITVDMSLNEELPEEAWNLVMGSI